MPRTDGCKPQAIAILWCWERQAGESHKATALQDLRSQNGCGPHFAVEGGGQSPRILPPPVPLQGLSVLSVPPSTAPFFLLPTIIHPPTYLCSLTSRFCLFLLGSHYTSLLSFFPNTPLSFAFSMPSSAILPGKVFLCVPLSLRCLFRCQHPQKVSPNHLQG